MGKTNWRAKEQIERKGFETETAFAERVGISRTVLSGILRGRIVPSPEEKEKINSELAGHFV